MTYSNRSKLPGNPAFLHVAGCLAQLLLILVSRVGGVELSRELEILKRVGASSSSYAHGVSTMSRAAAPQPALATYQRDVKPILLRACVDCHGADEQSGNIRIDTLDPNLFTGEDVSWWLEVQAVLTNGEMPPPEDGELSVRERTLVLEWLSGEIHKASIVRRGEQSHTSFRRMTGYEFNYALQDLLGLPFNFAKDLPPESRSEDGFFNSSETLHLSAMQLATYRTIARDALQRATVRGSRPPTLHWNVSMQRAAAVFWAQQDGEESEIRKKLQQDPVKLAEAIQRHRDQFHKRPRNAHYEDLQANRFAQARWSYGGAKYAWQPTLEKESHPIDKSVRAVLPAHQRLIVELGDQVPDAGWMKVSIHAARHSLDELEPSLQLEFGWQASNDSDASVRVSQRDFAIRAVPGSPRVYEWLIPLSEVYPRNSVRGINKLGDLPSPSEFLKLVNSSVEEGTIDIYQVDVQAPVYPDWPPPSHGRVLLDTSIHQPLDPQDEAEQARRILKHWMHRAWSRPVTSGELDQKMALFERVRPACSDFQEAIVEVLSTVLSSPKFLYLSQNSSEPNSDRLEAHDLAARLSAFLWCSLPDDELLRLADTSQLLEPSVLSAQVDRMLQDQRSERFARHFVRQWLGMQLLDYLEVDRKAHPHFDPTLREAMQQEPIAFFKYVLSENKTVLDFLHANYTLVNERLARHYGLPEVFGNHFRRVEFSGDDPRGGLLAQPGLLAMNSDGKDSHPLKRGIWLLENLLNDPPPPPPPAVPEIDLADPEIAKMTLKERMEDHRNDPACLSCHQKIDPWGIALEDFNAVGSFQWNTEVDSMATLANGQALDGVAGLKRYLLKSRQDQFVRAVVHKLTTYALGRPIGFSDRAAVEQITAEVRRQGDGLKTIVKSIVTSDLFLSKY